MNSNDRSIEFVTTARSKFSELDPYGHVNTQHYLAYFIDHRFIGLREQLGMDLKTIARSPVLFVTKKVHLEFLRPLYGDDEFKIRSHVSEFREKSCDVEMTMYSQNDEVISKCQLELVCFDRKANSVVAWPTDLIQKFYLTEKSV